MATFETTDLYCAAALKTFLQLPFPAIRVGGRLSNFIFEVDPIRAERASASFYNDSLSIPARRYAQDLRDLKALIFRAKEDQGR